jgi:hypothetical protein
MSRSHPFMEIRSHPPLPRGYTQEAFDIRDVLECSAWAIAAWKTANVGSRYIARKLMA